MSIETINTIIQAITSAGVIVAIVALAYQICKDRKEKAWEQASRVSCWILEKENKIRNEGQEYKESVIINNSSNEPIYDAEITLESLRGSVILSRSNTDFPDVVPCVPPGRYITEAEWVCQEQYSNFNAAICFRDSKGVTWYRDAIGILRKTHTKQKSLDSQFFYVPIREYNP